MQRRISRFVWAGALALAVGAPVHGAGFSIFEQGSRAMGMAGAFTAQASDGSAIFHNVGGIALQKERDFRLGTTLITNTEAEFEGAAPFPGEGVTAEQESVIFYPSHLYYVQPINDSWTWGIGLNNPYGLATEWKNEDTFAGRFISHRADLKTYDLVPSIGWEIAPGFGIGLSAIVRASVVELEQRAPFVNPFTQTVQDLANVELTSDLETDFGWQVGMLHAVNNSFRWGLSYKSKIEAEYSGDATFTQIPTGIPPLDAALSQRLPFDRDVPVTTAIEFPDMASLGLWIAITPTLSAEVDVNWTGWSSFDRLVVDFDDPRVPTVDRIEDWDDAYNYRLGFEWMRGNTAWRFGYVFDETPQPEEAAGPLLPDADRNGFTVGFGWEGNKLSTDLALMYLPFDERVVDTPAQHDNFLGTYNTTAWLFGVTLGWH